MGMSEQGAVYRYFRDVCTGGRIKVRVILSVYVCSDSEGNPLYVGQTSNITNRLYHHRSKSPWWPEVDTMEVVSEHDERADALYAEAEEIRRVRPKYNINHNRRAA